MKSATQVRQHVGTLLVTLQFGLVALLMILAAPAVITGQVKVGAGIMMAIGVAIGVWALAWNQPGKFNIRPTPHHAQMLIQEGPYKWIRHPMYTAVLIFSLACAWSASDRSSSIFVWSALAFIGLSAVLMTKALLEERWLKEIDSTYAAYMKRTKRFLPRLF